MIKKERLEELIKQGAKVWYFTFDEVLEEKLGPNHFVDWELDDMFLSKWDEDTYEPICDIYYIFEHKEEAEYFQWSLEFECIERTERLNIPDWQNFKNRDENFGFKVEDYSYKCFTDGRDIEVVEFWGCGVRSIFKAPLTKENYTLACRKCKELFLGEDK